MKRIFEPISVDTKRGWPYRLRRGDRIYRVQAPLDFWILQGRWWDCEEKRVYFRLRTGRGVLDVYRSRDEWTLARIID